MLHRIKTLVMMQLGARLDLSFLRNKGRLIANIAVKAVVFIGITLLIKILIPIFQGTLSISINIAFLKAIFFLTQIAAIVACTVGLMNVLYISKDNSILLSFPVKHSEIFVSKLFVYYFYEFRKNFFLIVPLFIGYALHYKYMVGIDLYYATKILVMAILVPFFPVFIGAIISVPLVFISNYLKRHPLINAIVAGALMFVAFLGISSIVEVITAQENLRLIAFRRIVKEGIEVLIVLINKYSLFYNNIIDAIFSGKSSRIFFSNLGIVLLFIAALVILVFSISMTTYFKLTNYTFDQAKKKRYRKEMKQIKSSYLIFLKKEFKILFRSSNQLISQFSALLFLPFLLYILNLIFFSLKISPFGTKIVIGVNILIGLLVLMASNTASATALTREGSEFYLLKTSPTKVLNITWAKITVNFVVAFIIILGTTLSLWVVDVFSGQTALMIGLVYLFTNTGHIFWSYELDLLNPKMHEYSLTQTIDDNPNATKSILLGTVIAIIFGAGMIVMLFENVFYAWLRLIILSVLFFLIRLYFLVDKSKVYFYDIV